MGRVALGGAAAVLLLCGCGQPELKLGNNIGLLPLRGETRTTLDPSACPTECRLFFVRDVAISTEKEVASLADYIKALDLEVKQLTFEDEDTGAVMPMDTQVLQGTLTIGGDATLSNVELAHLPVTARLEGPAIESLRDQFAKSRTAIISVSADMVVGPPIPRHLLVRYWVQPMLVIGAQD